LFLGATAGGGGGEIGGATSSSFFSSSAASSCSSTLINGLFGYKDFSFILYSSVWPILQQ